MDDKKTSVVAYIPALHAGYLNFLSKYPNATLFVLSTVILGQVPRLERDIRAIASDKITNMVNSLGKGYPQALELTDVSQLAETKKIILPDEDISRWFANRYLETAKHEILLEPVFLRWDRQISTAEQKIPTGRMRTSAKVQRNKMNQALEESSKSPDWWRQVGALMVTQEGEELVAHNTPMPSHDYSLNIFGDPRSNFDAGEHIELSKFIHAEAKIIAEAAEKGLATSGSTLYVTTYPCPPCAKLLAVSGVKKLYYKSGYSLLDAEDILEAANVSITLVE